jgi:uncharacterized protein (TIGR00255 family)
MTGYGMGESDGYKIEVRSINHKNLHIQVNIPSYLYYYEPEIRNLVKEKFDRGYIEVYFSRIKTDDLKVKINESLAREYYQALVSLQNELSISDKIGINFLAQQKDVFSLEEPDVHIASLRRALEDAIDDLVKNRAREGSNLCRDISERINMLREHIRVLEMKREKFVKNAKRATEEKLREILNDAAVEETRLIQEVAILVEKSDITEEIVRIKSHLEHLDDVLHNENIVGKKMGFIAQELNREMNTISAKSPDIEISSLIVEMKYGLEKIREQIQNLQ